MSKDITIGIYPGWGTPTAVISRWSEGYVSSETVYIEDSEVCELLLKTAEKLHFIADNPELPL
jgi:hypothetical protein